MIMLGDVIEHLRHPLATITDLLALLDDGGRMIISVPNVSHVDIRLMLLEGTWAYQPDGLLDETHLRSFTRQSLRHLLGQLGSTARRVERVRLGIGASGLPVTPGCTALRSSVSSSPTRKRTPTSSWWRPFVRRPTYRMRSRRPAPAFPTCGPNAPARSATA